MNRKLSSIDFRSCSALCLGHILKKIIFKFSQFFYFQFYTLEEQGRALLRKKWNNNYFFQDEKIDVQNTSAALDASWAATVNYHLLRKSLGTSYFDKDDGSYLRLSLGEFFAQRSEALGCLGGGSNVKRVSMQCVQSGTSHSCHVWLDTGPRSGQGTWKGAYFWLTVLESGKSRIRWPHVVNFW